jgi:hypothetical protein
MTNLERAQKLYAQVGQGQILEAFEKNYSEDIVMEEPSGKREGKEACRAHEEQFVANVEAFHGMDVKSIAEDEDKGKVFVEVSMDVTFKGGNRVLMEQVAAQTWSNGQIVHERFYYNA